MEKKIIILIKILLIIKYDNKIIGASFWIEDNKNTWGQFKPSITWGNQKWNGALANFNKRAKKIKIYLIKRNNKERNPDEMNKADPKAWIRKYFKAASE